MYRQLTLILLLCTAQTVFGGTPKSNYDILSELAKESSQSTGKFLTARKIDTIGLTLSHHPAQSLIQTALVAQPTLHFFNNDSKKNTVEIEIADLAVRYFRYSDSQDSLVREVQIHTSGIVRQPNEPMIPLPEFSKLTRDTIARTDVAKIENPGYSFTKSIVPEPEKSLLSEIAEPVVLFAVAAISVLLLFTIRSQ